jgi:hypothetical protein
MAVPYSIDTCRHLERAFQETGVLRPFRLARYENGTELTYDVTGVAPAARAAVRVGIERFVGGGFAGQVYRVKVLGVEGEPIAGLSAGSPCAMKILIPPSASAVRFRNLIYALGYQAPFALQVNPDAARAGALWQKFIRRAAGIELGGESAVVDIYGTFIDPRMGSCGELSEWLDGRAWRFEVDDNLVARRRWRVDDELLQDGLGSPEYRAKKAFMARLVELFHRLGAHELARQYEWWTCKSQPNVLKRRSGEGDAAEGLTAVDFRAGLALLAWLPMSPGDVKLIAQGLLHRHSLVQFDRGDISRLSAYVGVYAEHFKDMAPALQELTRLDHAYRDSQLDITHHRVRLLLDGQLRGRILEGARRAWQISNTTDPAATARLSGSKRLTVLFALLGLLRSIGSAAFSLAMLAAVFCACAAVWPKWRHPALMRLELAALTAAAAAALKLAAGLTRSLWGRADLRRHYGHMLRSLDYFTCAMRAHRAEALVGWHRAGRVSSERAQKLLHSPVRFGGHSLLALLPAGLHRVLSDWGYALGRIRFIATRPIHLYFNAAAREQWMRDMVQDGLAHGMLTEPEAQTIRDQLSEPFIQKYLKSLAVHVCTLPVTHVVAAVLAVVLILQHREWTSAQAWAYALVVLGAFQITPISPGSLTRGIYVLYLVIRERNYRDYKLAVWMGFWKYIGYLSFPLQMASRYPTIARFMAGRWATGAVHVLPVFGEHGALAEHAMFDLFYNRPLTIRRRMQRRAEQRQDRPARYWHVPLVAAAAWLAWCWLPPGAGRMILTGVTAGVITCLLAAGAQAPRRILMGGLAALLAAAGQTGFDLYQAIAAGANFPKRDLLTAFSATLLGLLAAAAAELSLGEPKKVAPESRDDRLTIRTNGSTIAPK